MPMYLPETKTVTVGADRADSMTKLTVDVRNRVPESLDEFVLEFCGANEDRALEWITSHIVSDENVTVRNEIEGLTPEKDETADAFAKRLQLAAQAAVDGWNAEKTRRVGTGVSSKAKAMDEITSMFSAGKTPAEIQAKLAEYASRFGVQAK